MKVEVIKRTENPLLKRVEVEFRIDHAGAPTPRRLEVKSQLAALLGTSEDLLVIERLTSTHGRQMATGVARVYNTREQLEAMEPKYLLKRGLPKEEKAAEAKPEKKAPPAKSESGKGEG
ncbi:30S ribosomal protein S24e [Candidatus Hadarchaeum sp.]|uniref:30S ribosomal protein S24e n=1 Tax=Candidatus Hadarchaeum sp. TaxID=2883567 RepID=UPI003D12A019